VAVSGVEIMWYLSELKREQMVLPLSLSYQPFVPRKMTCMLILLWAASLGKLAADLFGVGTLDLLEDVENI
jgi:hypothetical protein